ncbi:MAG: terminase TerL endonuclease subunit [Acidimicrobiales bacterium]
MTITDGDAISYQAVRAQLLADAAGFGRVAGIGFDPWNARQFAQQLQDDDGFSMVEVPQTMKSLAGGSHRLEQLVLQRALATDGSPVLRWMMGNAVARRDSDNRVRPDKAKSGQKIDAVSALVSAIAVELDGETSAPVRRPVRLVAAAVRLAPGPGATPRPRQGHAPLSGEPGHRISPR